uniref:Pectate lyase superfamily protein domain-containing protein n=1 Tax=Oryza punctata TaxID=4537 RepID=A0A0E0JY31_ORYPU
MAALHGHGVAVTVLLVVAALVLLMQCDAAETTCAGEVPARPRPETVSIVDFGGVGDGRTVNTWAFHKAVYHIQHQRRRGGTTLLVPAGTWLTGSFNLTSHMTLFLARGAVLKATQDTRSWPLVEPLPSYGRGRELPGARYTSFIHGDGLRDVVITGDKGIIDGQGDVWWNMWRQRTLQHTRPNLLEFMHSSGIHISNIVLKNSPFWNIHPVYCDNVVITNMMIIAPHDSPNTDGVDPDSSTNVCIEDSYISTGDDLVAIKSGWDEYGIAYGRPSSGITIRRVRGSSPFSGIAIGSEASGGVSNVLVEDCNIFNSGYGIHIKTNVGRGGYIRNITVNNVRMNNIRNGLRIAGDVGDHPDEHFSQLALPTVDAVSIKNVWGVNVQQPGSLEGIRNSPFTRICLSNVKLFGWRNAAWKCRDVHGAALGVQPGPCAELTTSLSSGFCSY